MGVSQSSLQRTRRIGTSGSWGGSRVAAARGGDDGAQRRCCCCCYCMYGCSCQDRRSPALERTDARAQPFGRPKRPAARVPSSIRTGLCFRLLRGSSRPQLGRRSARLAHPSAALRRPRLRHWQHRQLPTNIANRDNTAAPTPSSTHAADNAPKAVATSTTCTTEAATAATAAADTASCRP